MHLTQYQLNLLSALETQRIRLSASLAPEAYAELKFLEKAGFVKLVPPDPNFSYLPDYNTSDLFFALDSPGWQALHLEQDRLDREIKTEAKHKAEQEANHAQTIQDKKEDRRYGFKILVFGALISAFLDFVNSLISSHL